MKMSFEEKQTIALALKEKESLVVIDEKIGRNIAEYLGLKVTGTLGVLVKAKRMKTKINCRI